MYNIPGGKVLKIFAGYLPGRRGAAYHAEVRDMTWDEISRKYEQDCKTDRRDRRDLKLDKRWDELVKSTDKLVWLLSLPEETKAKPLAGR